MDVVEEGFLYAASNEVGKEYVKALLFWTVVDYTYLLASWFSPWKPGHCHCQLAAI